MSFAFFQTGHNGVGTTRFNGKSMCHDDSTVNNTIDGTSKIYMTGSAMARSDKIILKAVQVGGRGHYFWRKKTGTSFSYRGPISNVQVVRTRQVPNNVKATKEQQLKVELMLMPVLFHDEKVSRVFPNVFRKTTHHKSDALFSIGLISAPVHHNGVIWYRDAAVPCFWREWCFGNSCIVLLVIALTTAAFSASADAIPLLLEN